MDPQNTNQNPSPVISSAPSVPPPAVAPEVQLPTPEAHPVSPLEPTANTAQAPVAPAAPITEAPKPTKSPYRKLKIIAGVMLSLVILLFLASFTKQGKQVKQLILPSPSPIPAASPVGEVLVPTQYATDPEVLDIEQTLSSFDSKLAGTKLTEDSLRVPTLDYAVDFKKK